MKKGFWSVIAGPKVATNQVQGLPPGYDGKIFCSACSTAWNPKGNGMNFHSYYKTRAVFYRFYKAKDFDKAAKYYQSFYVFDEKSPDVHSAYKNLKRNDRRSIYYFIAWLIALCLLFWSLETFTR